MKNSTDIAKEIFTNAVYQYNQLSPRNQYQMILERQNTIREFRNNYNMRCEQKDRIRISFVEQFDENGEMKKLKCEVYYKFGVQRIGEDAFETMRKELAQ